MRLFPVLLIAVSTTIISVNASALDIFEGTILSDNSSSGTSRITKQNAYGPGSHMDQYGRNVTIQPMHNNTGSNTFNRIQKQDAYGPGVHLDQYGRAVTVKPKY